MSKRGNTSAIAKLKRRKRSSKKKDFDINKLVNIAVKTGKSVIGNEVTIIKIERPNRDNFTDQERTDERNEREEGSSPNLGATLHGGTTRMPGSGRGFMGRPGGGDTDVQAEMIKRLKEMGAGEETFIIPVGIQMLKPDEIRSEDKRPEMVEANISDIKQDKMINVWLNKDVTDRNIASFVLITL